LNDEILTKGWDGWETDTASLTEENKFQNVRPIVQRGKNRISATVEKVEKET